MAYERDELPGEIHLYLGTLEHPEDMFPTLEVFCRKRLPWLKLTVDGGVSKAYRFQMQTDFAVDVKAFIATTQSTGFILAVMSYLPKSEAMSWLN